MSLRKIPKDLTNTDYKHLKNTYNDSALRNPSHEVNLPTNFELKTITLEDIDQAVWQEFHKRFVVKDKIMPLIPGDAEIQSIVNQNYEQFDLEKGYLNGPFFVYTRTGTEKKFRTNPGKKFVLYAVPKMKAQGVVYEEYISTGAINYELTYEFRFVSDWRESVNEMEEQLNDYFKNKRNVILLNHERFSIGPVEPSRIGDVEIVNREDAAQRTMYVYTFKLKLYCYTFDASKVQKRERPNTYSLDIIVKDSKDDVVDETRETWKRDSFEGRTTPYFKHPGDK